MLSPRRGARTGAPTDGDAAEQIPLQTLAGDSLSVLTRVPVQPGSTVSSGAVVAEVSGQPIYLFESTFPFYRDMKLGDVGPDVRNLQSGLVELGYLGAADGNFGTRTADAVARLFRDAGYAAPAARSVAKDTASDGGETDTSVGYMPLSSLMAAKQLPATIRAIPAVGTEVTSSVSMTLDSSVAEIQVPLGEPGQLAVGDSVTVVIEGTAPFGGRVSSIVTSPEEPSGASAEGSAQADGSAQEDAGSSYALVEPDDASLLAQETVGRVASVTANRQALATDAMLVPLSAVSVKDGGARGAVMLRDADGFRRVDVVVIATYDGLAAIDSDDDAVSPGAEILLG